jgi:mRNA interferase MazF
MIKRFFEWIHTKEGLHNSVAIPPLVSRADIWWASIGENVGSEVNGKSTLFSRPVIIFKKLSHGFYFVIPTTTKIHDGTWYVKFHHQDKDMVACLHQSRPMDHRRLSSKIGTLDDADFLRVKSGFRSLYK